MPRGFLEDGPVGLVTSCFSTESLVAIGFVRSTHGVSVFSNPESVASRGYVPHEIDMSSVPPNYRSSNEAKIRITTRPPF